MNVIKKVGMICREARKSDNMTMVGVAYLTGYSHSVIWAFETGRSQNERLLLWYLKKFNLYDELKGVIESEKIF